MDVPVLVKEPRLLTENDVPWLINLGIRRYPNNYDPQTTENWLRNQVLKQFITFFATRTENACQISMLSLAPWTPAEPECNLVTSVAEEGHMWELIRLIRGSIEWARRRKCVLWRMSSDTSYDYQMIAKRLRAEEIAPRYVVRL